ncbi:MAG: sigma-70 family RNA polymerase sigma factor [Phycisphaeraceae bacterium]|nr:sigma-70 family RNA polymerase sigma factor [Phycisphaeraceae bacterium]
MTAARPGSTASPHADPEADLLARLRSGDEAAFDHVVREYGPRMLAVARRYLRSEADAQDAVQDAFLSAFKAIASFEGTSRLSTWLHRIAVNAALMKRRTDSRHPAGSIEGLLPAFDESGHHAVAPSPWRQPPTNRLDRDELASIIRSCIDRLPEPYRLVLLLRDIEELDTAQTAAHLGLTDAAVKTRLHRARQALRTLLDPYMRDGSLSADSAHAATDGN